MNRQWHFWCHGCKAEKTETHTLDHEIAAAVAWFAEHDGHRLGGFIEPVDNANV